MIRRYELSDADQLMELIQSEGIEWKSYYDSDGRVKYLNSLLNSITYVMIVDQRIIGYIRAIDDQGFDIYICDLLVHKDQRGHDYGKKLIEKVKTHIPNRDIYVMSDVDPYYIKKGFKKIGSIFEI